MTRSTLPIWRRIEFTVLLAALTVGGGIWGFVELLEVARDKTAHSFDTRILLAFRTPGDPSDPIGPGWVEEAMRDLTALGSTAILLFIVVTVLLYLLLDGKRRAALFILLAVAGGQVLSSFLKLGVERPRPDLVSHMAEVYTLSFPSGHAMLSAVTYLTLGSLMAHILQRRTLKIYVLSVAVIATLLVGISRVYLGVHWPTDVLAGWCAGTAWAMLCWLIAHGLQSSRARPLD
ncbi:phosphatase PAP2 family protein [Mesorhizobium sp. NBSH29]|uniref:phosphatase PAP2 family protein n=1 Tax=Mesorhizobium sp. NBSH29 TaxID=2654249 RepID=UPI0018965601|nr:phosphatase PAP2 family protein [Mesorhizobium sp. NBSH29]QPC86500.1 phosphatase PAP2 family protein [Mesorhizobium sp. NBSH29]